MNHFLYMYGIFVEDWKDTEKAFEDYYWKKGTKSSIMLNGSEEYYSLFHTSSYSLEYLTKKFAEGPAGKKLEAFRETVKVLAKDTLSHHFHAKTRVLDCELCVYVECYHLLYFMEQNKIEIPFIIEELIPMERKNWTVRAWVKIATLNLQTRNEIKKAGMRVIPLFEDQQSWNWDEWKNFKHFKHADFHYSGDFHLKISSPEALSFTGKRRGSHLHLRANIDPWDCKELISTDLDIVYLDITIDLKKTLQIIKEHISRMFDAIPFLVSDLYEPILSYVFLHFE